MHQGVLSTCKLKLVHIHLSAPNLLWSSLLLSTALGLSCRSNLQKSLPTSSQSRADQVKGECCPKKCSSGKKCKCSKLGRCHGIPSFTLCVPGISNWTESQLNCLWFSWKSRQDTKLSCDSSRVRYQFHGLPGAPLGLPQRQFFPTKCDTDWKGLQENSQVLVEYKELEKLVFLSYRPDHNGLSTDLQGVSFPMSSQSLLFGLQITHTKAQVSHNIKKNKTKPVLSHLLHAQKTSCTAPGQWKL